MWAMYSFAPMSEFNDFVGMVLLLAFQGMVGLPLTLWLMWRSSVFWEQRQLAPEEFFDDIVLSATTVALAVNALVYFSVIPLLMMGITLTRWLIAGARESRFTYADIAPPDGHVRMFFAQWKVRLLVLMALVCYGLAAVGVAWILL